MRYDTLIIGAGMSGLAAGIRLAAQGRRVAICERHYLWGGLNSFYKLGGRRFDTGLHALTNFAPKSARGAPLVRLLRHLGIPYDELRLAEQGFSEIAFLVDGEILRLRFSNDVELLLEEAGRLFPGCADRLRRMIAELPGYGNPLPDAGPGARELLRGWLADELLAEMLLAPPCFYGSAREGDLEGWQLPVLFRSIFLEGLARPEGGIKRLLDLLVSRFREEGGELRMKSGVARVVAEAGAVRGVVLDDGTELECERVLSSAGWPETMALVDPPPPPLPPAEVGVVSFLESVSVLDRAPADLGLGATITFFNEGARLRYGRPRELVDARSGVACAPNNYRSREPLAEGIVRVTVPADPLGWKALEEPAYRAAKERASDVALASAARFVPDVRPHVVFGDVFTPRTIERFTGRRNGAIYGSPAKRRDGSTPVAGLELCGTDQGMVGVVGALMGGIAMANRGALVPHA